MKAFLSHSSVDKELVRKIAQELGRQFCILDEQAFANGAEFKASIRKGLTESSVFVLIASKASLKSMWVEFEINEIENLQLQKHFSYALVYQIDSDVQLADFPEWMKRLKIKREISPKIIARDIKQRLDELLRDRAQHIYIPRTVETEALTSAITSLGQDRPTQIILVSGLPGSGRKTLVRRVAPSLLNFQRTVEIPISSGDTLHDLAIKFADRAEPYSTPEGLQQLVATIRSLDSGAAVARIVTDIRILQSAGELLMLIDEGGLLDENGSIQGFALGLLHAISAQDGLYCILVTKRSPISPDDVFIPKIQVLPLSKENTKKLLTLAARHASLTLSPKAAEDLSEFIAGYPPAAFYAVNQAKAYGLDLVLNDKRSLVEFRSAVFLKHLSNLSLADEERFVLQSLSAFSPLPFKIISDILHPSSSNAVSVLLIRLIDLSLIYVDEHGFYRISEPIATAVDRVLGFPNKSVSLAIAQGLDAFIKNLAVEESGGLLDLMRLSFRALSWGGNTEKASHLVRLTSDVHRLIESFFHAQEYERALEFARLALKQGTANSDVYYFCARSLINLERWDEAEEAIREYTKVAPKRDVDYLLGYFSRKKGDTKRAIDYFKSSESGGRKGGSIGRELALCYMLAGEYSLAKRYLDAALQHDPDNRYLVDLAIKLATETRNEPDARKSLDRLKLVDSETFYFHRLSCVELAFGNRKNAVAAARSAFANAKSAPFAIVAQLVVAEVEHHELKEAESHLDELDRQYPNRYGDIRAGLHCKLELARGRFNEALGWIERTKNQKLPVHLLLKAEAIRGLLTKSSLADGQRAEYVRILPQLEAELSKADRASLTLI
jgi:tetratricopeptide (TPR) repeat protein